MYKMKSKQKTKLENRMKIKIDQYLFTKRHLLRYFWLTYSYSLKMNK